QDRVAVDHGSPSGRSPLTLRPGPLRRWIIRRRVRNLTHILPPRAARTQRDSGAVDAGGGRKRRGRSTRRAVGRSYSFRRRTSSALDDRGGYDAKIDLDLVARVGVITPFRDPV